MTVHVLEIIQIITEIMTGIGTIILGITYFCFIEKYIVFEDAIIHMMLWTFITLFCLIISEVDKIKWVIRKQVVNAKKEVLEKNKEVGQNE